MNPELISTSMSTCRPALSWCSKCGQSTEISSESNLFKTKTNFKFRKIFDFDKSEVLIKSFSCALVDDMLFQGTLYTSQNHFCFFSRIANKHRKIIISISQIVEITKEKTVGIFPNAIAIKTQHNRHLFASFVYRDSAYRCLTEVWGAHHTEKFSTNWNIAYNDDACSKESPLVDIEIEADSLITPILLTPNDLSNDDLLEEIDSESYYPNVEESLRKGYKSKGVIKGLNNPNPVTKNVHNCTHGTTASSLTDRIIVLFSSDHIHVTLAALIIISLILYIIFLAWRIHTLQFTLLEKFISPKILGQQDNIDVRKIFRTESLTAHPSRMSKVQSDLKETLNLLQGVVEMSAKIFNRLKTVSIANIIPNNKDSPNEI